MSETGNGGVKAEELIEIIRGIRDRVRERHPSPETGDVSAPLADLMPVLHARDAAEAKTAAIGAVNPRPPGLANNIAQAVKRWVARALDWHVRGQVEFNQAAIECINATIEALNENNRALVTLAQQNAALEQKLRAEIEGPLREELRETTDIRSHWHEWRRSWEEKIATNEIQFLRGLADLRAAYEHRITQYEEAIRGDFRETVRVQHQDFENALERSAREIQRRLWDDLERIRADYERLIHNELRVARQRMAAQAPVATPALAGGAPAPAAPSLDYLRFAERFRGTEEYVKRSQVFYREKFRGCRAVLDIGCGRGEFLEAMREEGIPARGIDIGAEFIALCRRKGLDAEEADLFEYLSAAEDGSLGGIFCAQVIEHLPPARLPELVNLAAAKLRRGGVAAFETPNPECLAIFATHFYLDPTHTRPVPASLMVFCLEEAGFGNIEVRQLSPAEESLPELAVLPAEFRRKFFGGLDYAVIGTRL